MHEVAACPEVHADYSSESLHIILAGCRMTARGRWKMLHLDDYARQSLAFVLENIWICGPVSIRCTRRIEAMLLSSCATMARIHLSDVKLAVGKPEAQSTWASERTKAEYIR